VRGLAITLVVAFHWFGLPFGWVGVDLFFILSGYLIGGILIDNRNSASYFSTFYARRALRILPLYLLFLVVTRLLFGLSLPIWHYLTFTQNLAWERSGLLGAGATGLTWSLAVEEQFYLLLPVLVRTVTNQVLLRISVGLILVAPACRWLLVRDIGMNAPYVLLPGRMDTLFAGVLIACIVRHPEMRRLVQRRLRLVQILSGGAFAGFITLGSVLGFTPVSLPMYLLGDLLVTLTFGFGLTAVVVVEDSAFRHKMLGAVGVGAYSIYLCHQSMLFGAVTVLGAGCAALLAAIIGTIVLSLACWLLLERPLIRYARVRWRYEGRSLQQVPLSHCVASHTTDQIIPHARNRCPEPMGGGVGGTPGNRISEVG
jgi:peptidoglycan/LPS O-acetylase OafA/YrhL